MIRRTMLRTAPRRRPAVTMVLLAALVSAMVAPVPGAASAVAASAPAPRAGPQPAVCPTGEVPLFAGAGTLVSNGVFFPGTAIYDGEEFVGTPYVIARGCDVRFVNLDAAVLTNAHVITAFDRQDGRPVFQSETVDGPGETLVETSHLEPGVYPYYCSIHFSMYGLLEVRDVADPGGGPEPDSSGRQAFTSPLVVPETVKLGDDPHTVVARRARLPILPGRRTRAWTFGGSFPGPTLVAQGGKTARVRFANKLPKKAGDLTVHLHGSHHPSSQDGQPARRLIKRGRARTYTYPLTVGGRPHRGATLWYHDHSMGRSGRNIWNGLTGMFLVRDRFDRKVDLPVGRYDVPLMLADRTFDERNQMPYPESALNAPPRDEAVGEVVTVNGVPQPFFKVAARRYRLRILNASNFTFYNLRLSNGGPMVQVAMGQGLLPRPVPRETILLGPSQRVEVVVDFRGLAGEDVVLESVPRPQTDVGIGTPALDVMQFRVARHRRDRSRMPERLRPLPRWVADASTSPDRRWALGLGVDEAARPAWTINGRTFDPERVDARVELDSVETWEVTNTSNQTHVLHVHGVPMVLLRRNGQPAPAWEAGLADTWILDPGDRVLLAGHFPDYTGKFMLHCHMLEHEDHGMMAQFEVVARSDEAADR